MAVQIGPRIGIEGEKEYRKQLQNLIQQTKTFGSEMKTLESSFTDSDSAMKKAAERSKVLKDQYEAQSEKVKQLEEAVKKSTEVYGDADTKTQKWKQALYDARTELNNLQTELKDNSAIKAFGEDLERNGEKLKNIGGNMQTAGRSLTRSVTMPIAGAVGYAVKQASDFEAGMSKVEAISGATGDELAKLSDRAMELASATKYTTTEATDALSYMAMAGWDTEQMYNGLEGVMYLAGASGNDLASVSDIVTDAMTALNMTAGETQKVMRNGLEVELEDSARFVDVLAAASNSANTDVEKMGESFKYVAPVAGTLGYTIEDTAIALGLLANNGIKSSMAGTSLRNIMQRMAKPTKDSETAMNALGIQLYDLDGNMYSLKEIMDQMRSSFGDIMYPVEGFSDAVAELDAQLEDGTINEKTYGEEIEDLIERTYGAEAAEKARYAAMLGGARAMPAILAIVNSSQEEYDGLADAIYNSEGAAKEMYQTMNDNLQGSFTRLQSSTQVLAQQFGEELTPILADAVDKLIDMVAKFRELDPEQRKQILKWAGIAAAAGPALIVLGKIASTVGTLVSGVGKLLEHSGSLQTILAANPAALAVGGIVGLSAAIAWNTRKVYEDSEELKTLKTSLNDTRAALDSSKEGFDALNGSMKANSDAIAAMDGGQFGIWREELEKIVDAEGKVKTGAEESADYILNQLNTALGTDFQVAADGFITNADGIVQSMQDINTEIDTMVTKMQQQALGEAVNDDYTTALQEQKTAQSNAETAIDNYTTAAENLRSEMEMLSKMQEQYNSMLMAGAELGDFDIDITNQKKAVEESKKALEEATAQLSEAVGYISEADLAVQGLEEIMQSLATGTTESVDTAKEKYAELPSTITEVGGQIQTDMDTQLAAMNDKLLTGGEAAGTQLATGLDNKRSDVNTSGEGLGSATAEGVKNKRGEMEAAADWIVDGYIQQINKRMADVVAANDALGKAAIAGTAQGTESNSPSRAMMRQGEYVVQGFLKSIDAGMGAVRTAGRNLGAAVLPYSSEDATGVKLDGVVDAIHGINGAQNVTVVLQGDAAKFFKAMQTQGNSYQKRTGNKVFG